MGKIFCFGSDVDTDQIIASQYLLYPSVEEMAPHCFESLDENFATAVQAGDFVVARDNFGCGSSREQAPAVLKALGVRAVFANSFARPRERDGHGGRTELPLHQVAAEDAGNPGSGRTHCGAESGGSIMAMTMAEKIIARAAGKPEVHAGDIETVTLDYMMSNDGTTHLTIGMYENLKHPRIADKNKLVWIVDHNVPADSVKTAASHKKMRDFARANGIAFYEGEGVCHQIMLEKYVSPGQFIFGADSHTCAYGALGAFGTGVGCTDYLYAMVTGQSWVLVPKTLRFELRGKLRPGVYARDLILTIIGKIGANGANYKAMEFGGEGLRSLGIADRAALCNLCVEAGAKTGLCEVDEMTLSYLKEQGREPLAVLNPDADADYEEVFEIDLSEIRPIVAKPHFVDNVVPAEECSGIHIDEAFLGSCNNGRIEDLRVGAELLRGRKVADSVRFLVVPASRAVYEEALREGLLKVFMDAGAIVMNPNCSVCWGSCQGVIGEGETLISTGTRNFKGRSGHKDSYVYLASAATVTASAVKGEICTAESLTK